MTDEQPAQQDFRVWLLEQLRKRRWNQSELARRAGITQGMVSRYTNGLALPNEYGADRIARALSVDADIVRGLVGIENQDRPPESLRAGELIGMVKRVDWRDDVKFNTISGILRMYLGDDATQEDDRRRFVQLRESP